MGNGSARSSPLFVLLIIVHLEDSVDYKLVLILFTFIGRVVFGACKLLRHHRVPAVYFLFCFQLVVLVALCNPWPVDGFVNSKSGSP